MCDVIKNLIEANTYATNKIASIENDITNFSIVDDKTKANYGNLCIALKGYRMVAEATECILINADVLKGDDGNFYEKVATNEEPTKDTAEQTNKSE